jgi:uncharacterized membrane protein
MIDTSRLHLLGGGAAIGALVLGVLQQLFTRHVMPDLTLNYAIGLGAAIGGAIGNRVGILFDISIYRRVENMEWERVETDLRLGRINGQQAEERRRAISQTSIQHIVSRRLP